jgi:alpha-glucosidase (family GH31 glycosyl hydrolase)
VLWFDIDYATDKAYFKFDPGRFSKEDHSKMNEIMEQTKRRFVVITDPHIKAKFSNLVYDSGEKAEKDHWY